MTLILLVHCIRIINPYHYCTLDDLWHISTWLLDQVSVVRDLEVTRSCPRGSNRDRRFGDQDPDSSGVAGWRRGNDRCRQDIHNSIILYVLVTATKGKWGTLESAWYDTIQLARFDVTTISTIHPTIGDGRREHPAEQVGINFATLRVPPKQELKAVWAVERGWLYMWTEII